jgi:CspA family cold shock protein
MPELLKRGVVGSVTWFHDAKGYGFIWTPEGEVFVHRSGLTPPLVSLDPGEVVEFDVEAGRKGPQAVRVRVRKPAEKPAEETP